MIDETPGNPLQTVSIALQTLALGMLLVCASLMNVAIGPLSISMMFLPAALLFFWPRRSKFSAAIAVALFIGLFQDLVSGGPLGMWALTYTLLFIIIDPTVRRSRGGLLSQWSVFIVLILTVALMIGVLGRLSMNAPPDYGAMAINSLAVILVFPIMFGLRRFIYQVSGRDDAIRGS